MINIIKKIKPNFRFSIFTKLILILFVTGILMNVIAHLFFFTWHKPKQNLFLVRHLENYLSFILEEKIKCEKIKSCNFSEKKYPGLNIISISKANMESNYLHDNTENSNKQKLAKKLLWEKGILKAKIIASDNKEYSIFFNVKEYFLPDNARILYFLFVITFILFLAYLLIRYTLRPIKYISTGISEVSSGNLDYQIPVSQKDELGILARTFNRMTYEIKNMLESRRQFLLDVGHELRTPLTRIKLALEMSKPSVYIDSIKDDIQEMETMISEILESHRLNSSYGKITVLKTDIVKIVKKSVSYFHNKECNIEINNPYTSYNLVIDGDRILTVLNNILGNACRYSKKSTKAIQVNLLLTDPKTFQITIQDFGEGIEAKDLPNIFEPFFRSDPSRSKETGGYGLGLYLCKRIVEAHNGSIRMESIKEKFSTVTIKLPV